MGHVFQGECWKKHPSGCSFRLLWLKKIGKGNGKGFGRQEELIGILFMEIKEIGRNIR